MLVVKRQIIQYYFLLSYHIRRNFPTNIILHISFENFARFRLKQLSQSKFKFLPSTHFVLLFYFACI